MAWKNIRIQGKFTLGFGFIILLLVALSAISIYNILQLVDNADQVIQGNYLKTSILQKEVDHLNWEMELSSFLNDSSSTELSVETDPRECAFGKWFYGGGRREAEEMVPQLIPVLSEVESYHNSLHASAVIIEENHSTVDQELGIFFRERKMDLITLRLDLHKSLTEEDSSVSSIGSDYEKSELGQWIYSGEMDRAISLNPAISSLCQNLSHAFEVMHDNASLLEELVSREGTEEALVFFLEEMEASIDETLTSLEALIDWHDGEMERLERGRQLFVEDTHDAIELIRGNFNKMIEIVNANILTEDVMLQNGKNTSLTLLIISIIIALFALIMSAILSVTIIRPITKCVNFAEQISTGDLDTSLDIDQKDQIGQLCLSLKKVLRGYREKAEVIGLFAEGDLSAEVATLSEKDGLGISLQKMKTDLNDMIGQISSSVEQISSGADQIARASQNLSEGAATQASSTEEVSVMVNQISGQAAQNSDNASQAKSISEKATQDAEEGNRNMSEVVALMEKINGSADETKKIVKVIDDIAFQINLLALNANVEAARAGKYGKGFAVVADEVRNLAVKSAQAAKETSDMVEESIRNIRNGSEAVQVSANQLVEIVNGSRKVSEILEEIEAASKNQDDGISQATSGLDQIDKITQDNTSSAEQTASAAEELSSQSLQLKALVNRFKLDRADRDAGRKTVKRIGYRKAAAPHASRAGIKPVPPAIPVKKPEKEKKEKIEIKEEVFSTGIKPVNPSEVISLDDNDFDQF